MFSKKLARVVSDLPSKFTALNDNVSILIWGLISTNLQSSESQIKHGHNQEGSSYYDSSEAVTAAWRMKLPLDQVKVSQETLTHLDIFNITLQQVKSCHNKVLFYFYPQRGMIRKLM